MKNTVSFADKNESLDFILSLPKKWGQHVPGVDIDKTREKMREKMHSIVLAFAPRIVASLKRRMSACRRSLLQHIDDIDYNDGQHISWYKNGQSGSFNVPSFNAMEAAIETLEMARVEEFCKNKVWVDQTLKALLNDTEQDHSDARFYKYSQLVSILCEIQSFPV